MATSKSWQLFVHDGRHNHAIGAYHHGHVQYFRKSHMPPHNMLPFFREQNMDCAVRYIALHLLEIIQRPCQDEEEKDAWVQHGRRSSLFKCSMGLYIIYGLCFKFKFMMYSLYNMSLLEAIGMTQTSKNFTRRRSPSWYMRWLGKRPRCTRVIIYPRSKWDRSTRDVIGTMTTPNIMG
ncbi:hypothetical protein M9H77_09595 [Catharanthus roseus]|uniref:Uncharacterized protein n=1 Tax=Catharanthus roseus TaxID=4058 RepID=A0ACC0C186_CATRO|nr:hypothetical protein M9H77_09595 [Catharanthus roseus]